MASKRVLVLESDLLFNAGVQSLLAGKEDVQVMGLEMKDASGFLEIMDQFKPDVVIIDDNSAETYADNLLGILSRYPAISTVLINLQENLIEIVNKKRVPVNQLGDFLAVI